MLLELRKINAFYGNIQVLHNLSLSIGEGEIVCLIGSNGAGKSTTLMTISGVVPCHSGSILFQGRGIDDLSPEKIVRLGISQVPEGRHIFPRLTVAENLDMGAFLRNDKKEIRRDLDYIYTLFPILKQRQKQPGGNLSGGEQQMLAISRALMSRPRLLLLDEPSMGLAPITTRKIFEIIQQINREQNTTIFLVEQNAHLALKISARGYVLENGRVTIHDTSANLLVDENVRKAYMGV